MRKEKSNKEKSDSSIPEEIQKKLLGYLDDEFQVAKRNMGDFHTDFDEYYDMIHCIRKDKPNEWESDISMPEFISRLLTQIGNFGAQYFSSRDYVEPDIDSEDPIDVGEAKASKKLLNLILNNKKNHYYQKIIRLLMFVFPSGYGIIKGGYSQKTEQVVSGYTSRQEYVTDDKENYLADDGNPYSDPYAQRPMINEIQEPTYETRVVEDRPTFDVYPIQNVYMSQEYGYSLQEKEQVIFETEKTLDQLEDVKEQNGYFNLNLLKESDKPEPQKRNTETSNKDEDFEEPPKPVSPKFKIYERWGKYPVVFKDSGEPEPGIDEYGEFKDNVTNIECIITSVKKSENDNLEYLIGFRNSPHSERPMVRFLCYVDPIKDAGFGDGEVNRELQTAVNDNYNLMNYRTKLSITPAFKAKRFAGIESNIRIQPEQAILLENLEDLVEFDIKDNIQGGIVHQNLLSSRMDYAMATSPQTMGMEPERKETATAASIIDRRAGIRIGMKSMNLEFIGFTDFYDMLLTLCNDFMLPETLVELIGDDAFFYNPKREDKFKPVSQALETEESKSFKVRMWDQILGKIVQIPNPKTPMAVNYILGQVLEIFGGSFKHFKKFMFSEDEEANVLYQLSVGGKMGMPGGGTGMGSPGGGAPQNQGPLPQSGAEEGVRMEAGM